MRQIGAELEKYRNKRAEAFIYGLGGNEHNGVFNIPLPNGDKAHVIVSNGMGWEHVSVSLKGRCPRWQEMCYIKSLFWTDDEVVVQFHPKKEDYVNIHNNCLHLWRPCNSELPTPPKQFV